MATSSPNPFVDADLAARFALGVVELFHAGQTLAQIQAAVHSAGQWAGYCLDLIEQASPGLQPPACRAGCDACCYNQVELTAPEAIILGAFLTERLWGPERQFLQERLARSLARRAGKTKAQLAAMRAHLPCPLLEGGTCLAYEARPLMCRAMHSLEAEACRRELADPSLNVVQFYSHRHTIHVSLSQGLIDGCLALGYQAGPLDLPRSLVDFWAAPDLAERWLAGENVFGG
jgi:Fe-S-cluster containining protein